VPDVSGKLIESTPGTKPQPHRISHAKVAIARCYDSHVYFALTSVVRKICTPRSVGAEDGQPPRPPGGVRQLASLPRPEIGGSMSVHRVSPAPVCRPVGRSDLLRRLTRSGFKGGRGHCRVAYLLAFGFRAVGAVLAFVIAVRACDPSGPFVVADGAGAGPGAADLHSGG